MPSPIERVLDKTLITEACWEFTGFKNEDGYGLVTVGPRGASKTLRTHRVVYEHFVGPIPEGLVLDHLCENRSCVRFDHLAPTTVAGNVMRSPLWSGNATSCKRGHPFTDEHVQRRADGRKYCKTCQNAKRRARCED